MTDERVFLAGGQLALRWLCQPQIWSVMDGSLLLDAAGGTNWFVDPAGVRLPVIEAPALVSSPDGDYQLSARVEAALGSPYDAGALVLWAGEGLWAKLCFELSPQREPMVVSVVTRGSSDDANAFVVPGDHVWLRVSRFGSAFAFHASLDGDRWLMVRYFALDRSADVAVGFQAQSPTGKGCTVTFSDIRYTPTTLTDLRGGP